MKRMHDGNEMNYFKKEKCDHLQIFWAEQIIATMNDD